MRVRRVGIETRSGTLLHPRSEEEFFATLGVPYLAPHERDLEG
jgi:DNA polymerase/3'-5' exonuclease PolX